MSLPLLLFAPPTAHIGPGVPSANTLSDEIRQTFPPAVLEALDGIGAQIQVEILDPLLCSPSPDSLARAFADSFNRFAYYYSSTVYILAGYLFEEPQRLTTLTTIAFERSSQFVRTSGKRWLGQETCNRALRGIATITKIAEASALRLHDVRPPAANGTELVNSILGHVFAFSGVLHALRELDKEPRTKHRLANVVLLAQWSDEFAQRAYHASKVMGVLAKRERASVTPDVDDAEDVELANAGLASYIQGLAQDEQ